MNVFSQLNISLNTLMSKFSSALLASDDFIESFLASDNFFTRIFQVLLQVFYFGAKWMMYIIDVIYFYILQLAGVSADTSVFDSASSDMTLRMLIDNKEFITGIIKNLLAIAIVLILVTAVIAIIKQQATALKEKKAKKSPTGDVLRSIFKSFLLIVLTPLFALVGIVASSVLLQSLFNATNLSQTKSLSARVFNASASSANKYRAYAENGVRIPIKYKFSGDDKNNAISYTVKMLGNSTFPSLSVFDDSQIYSGSTFIDPVLGTEITATTYTTGTEEWLEETYYTYYDSSDNYKNSSDPYGYKKMTTHVDEYYAMSDVIGYALDTMEEYYFMTIQEVLERLVELESISSGKGVEKFKEFVTGYNIRLVDSSNNVIDVDKTTGYLNTNDMWKHFKSGSYAYIRYTSVYSNGTHTYYHVKNAIDEMDGAKFIIAYKGEYPSTSYVASINGDYYKVGSNYYKIEDKYYYKPTGATRYQKVDLFYTYNADKGEYKKAQTISNAETYYYKLGETYHVLTDDLRNNFEHYFFYKDKDGKYKNMCKWRELETPSFYTNTPNYYYAPLSPNVEVGNNEAFDSDYIVNGMITARGIFDKSSYPTAIRRISNGNIMFYRDDLELVSEGTVSDVGKLDQIEAEDPDAEEEEEEGFFKKVGSAVNSVWNSVKKFATSLFNPLKLVPDLNIDTSKMSTTYTNQTSSVATLEDGKMQISYFFSDSITSKLTSNMFSLNLNNLFDPMSINYVILIIGSVAIFKVMTVSVFGFIIRTLNILILILIYPVACSTIPLDEATGKAGGGSYAKWSKKFTELLFTTFGLVLSLNFVFIIIPAIDKITFFTPENLQSNKALARISNALFNPLSLFGVNWFAPNYNMISKYLNKLIRLIFQISAFAVIAPADGKASEGTFYGVIQTVVGVGKGALDGNPVNAVKKTLKTVTTIFNMVFLPQKFVMNIISKGQDSIKKAKENSEVLKDAKDRQQAIRNLTTQQDARNNLINAMDKGESADSVQSKLDSFIGTDGG